MSASFNISSSTPFIHSFIHPAAPARSCQHLREEVQRENPHIPILIGMDRNPSSDSQDLAHQNPAQARPFWHIQKGTNAATGSTPVSNSPTHPPVFPQAGTDRDENIPVRGHPSSSPEQGLCHHVTYSPACMLLPNPAFHGLSATGAYPGGSQLEHSKTTSQ